jgi:hypothetical protein
VFDRAPPIVPAHGMQIAGVQLVAAIADDLIAGNVEHIDAPVRLGREQVGSDREQLIRTAKGTLRNASSGSDVPVSIGTAVHRQDGFPFFAHAWNVSYSTAGDM